MQRHLPLRALWAALLDVLIPVVLGLRPAGAVPPPGYYASVDTGNPVQLRATLHAVIDDHTRFPYSSASTDTWDILEQADENPANSAQILDLYRNRAYTKFGGGAGPYNREHSWPNSYGFPDDGPTNYPYTDCHHLFLSDVGYNADRANKPFGDCTPGATERVTDINGGQGGGSGLFPGNSNWFTGNFWQTWIGRKGDVARAMFYLDVRYEGGTHGVTGAPEPDLVVTDNLNLITSTGGNASVAYMGLLSVLVRWNAADPVDDRERAHNDAVFSFQGNRNPFVDHPDWVNALFVPSTGPTIASIVDVPADQGGQLQVAWQRNSLDIEGSIAPIAQYAIQRLEGTWVDVAFQPATHSAAYSLVIPTGDIASPSMPQPNSQYRVAAIESGGTVRLSNVVAAFSIDNLPPPAPVLSIDLSHTPWVLSWIPPSVPDFGQSCLYRNTESGFTPATPLLCTAATAYLEHDMSPYFYVLRFSDAHGNWSQFSNEVSGVPTDTSTLAPLRTAIRRVYPNPFNPSATVSFSLAQAGPVRIDVFAADGRFVCTLLDGYRSAGDFAVRWDGTDTRGTRLANGPYWLRLLGSDEVDTYKAVLAK